jgi:hypothetical protein
MKSFLFLILAASFLWAASDSTYDTAVTTISWKGQPNQISVDKKGNTTAWLPSEILATLPYDSANGITWNTQGANNIWRDSLQNLDTIVFSAKKVPADTVLAYYLTEMKKYLKQQSKTKRVK